MLFGADFFSGNIDLVRFDVQVKGSDTSTAESGSEADDIASPKSKNYSHLRLTPVREEVGLALFN